ncbi:serine hydrolase [Patescibacteria group bacterium]|nr:serine hydrolase [Patescibacteria group bacterium]
MDEQAAPRRPIVLVSHEDDHSLVTRGGLIPLGVQTKPVSTLAVRPKRALMLAKVSALVLTVLGLGALYGPALETMRIGEVPFATAFIGVSSPELKVEDPFTGLYVPPQYGPRERYSDRSFYEKTRADMVTAGASFIDINIVDGRAKLFARGVLEEDVAIVKAPTAESWCTVPAGLYQVESVVEDHFSTYLDAYLPSSIVFYGNRFVHGWPNHPDFSAVDASYERDCLRLSSADAERFYRAASVGMPVVVHAAAPRLVKEPFTYESKIKDFSTPYYLIADLADDTILAVGERHVAVPVASLTKLMTALVVLEEMALDTKIAIQEPNLIETVVPRLSERSRVSVHTLLELLLVESSNEAAEVLAGALGREKFIAIMNERAAELGLVDTIFTDPSGLDSGNVSSVNDLWWLTRYINEYYPFIISVTRGDGTATTTSAAADGYAALSNFNSLDNVDSFIGGKIGETEAAKQTSASLHRLTFSGSERDIVIVLLQSNARTDDVKALLAYLEERFGE